ncbi:hypothetical protein Taro_023977 [Colocasia esculenta]|uniref:Uncharacterized protein n=1 Tax=Colocasia esculenta TaxID=4460 RepID=A0A843VD22_COLES|nr:hypothetical protein [Colocasia esculenta]
MDGVSSVLVPFFETAIVINSLQISIDPRSDTNGNDPISQTHARDPKVRVATHGSKDPEGLEEIVTNVQRVPNKSTGTRRKVQSLRGIPRELAKYNSQLTQVQELTTLALTAADNTRHHSRLRNPSDTELP